MTTLAMATEQEALQAARRSEAAGVYWHRQLPLAQAEMKGEHVLEATSRRVSEPLEHRDEQWDNCYRDLMENATVRLKQEIDRLGGNDAHVLGESVDSRRDDAANETWLHGRFTYVLCCRHHVLARPEMRPR